jgi:CheY-like chemotaxis protein
MNVREYVLIVDDDRLFAQTVCHALQADGFVAVPVSTGAQALAVIDKFRPRLILLDLRMPTMDGEHFLGILKSQPTLASIPLIIISAKMNDAEAKELTALGAVAAIGKNSATLPQLRELVKGFMEKKTTKAA